MATTTAVPRRRPTRKQAQANRPRPIERDTPIVPPPISVHSAVESAPTLSTQESESLDETEQILEVAKRRYKTVCQAEGRLRRDMLDDRRFRLGHLGDKLFQWPPGLLAERDRDKRPVLQINRMGQAVAIAKNQGDNANLRIQVNPVDNTGDVKVAQVISGLIRNVETRSFAEDDAYATAADGQCEMGRGYIWVLTEWEGDDSWKQRACIERVLDPFRVKVDRSAQKKDQSDAEFSFYDTDIDMDTWRALYGTDPETGEERPLPNADEFNWSGGMGDQRAQWFPSDDVVSVKHYFAAEYTDDTLYDLSKPLPDGRTSCHDKGIDDEVARLAAKASQMDPTFEATPKVIAAARKRYVSTYVKRQRPVKIRKIIWRVIDAKYIHEETVWTTPWQPLIPMLGEESELSGEYDVRGVIRDGKSPQMVYNVEVSAQAEAINDMPKAPWVGVKGVFGKPNTPMNESWKDANRRRYAYLEYEPVDIDGKAAGPPIRTFAEPFIRGINEGIQQADNDIKSTTRIHEASLGVRGPQESGVAIDARTQQDALANSHYSRNRRRCLMSAGRQLIRIFRSIYDVATVVRITGVDGQKKSVMVFNGDEHDPRIIIRDGEKVQDENFELPPGVEGVYNIGTGDYDVEVSAAPDAGSQRQKDFATIVNFVKLLPPQYTVNFMDLLFKLIDTPVGLQLSERADKLLRPDLRDVTDAEGNEVTLPPEVMQEVTKLKQRDEELTKALKAAEETIKTKRVETESRESIETMKRYIELVRMIVSEDNQDRRLMLESKLGEIDRFMSAASSRVQEMESSRREADAAAPPTLTTSDQLQPQQPPQQPPQQ